MLDAGISGWRRTGCWLFSCSRPSLVFVEWEEKGWSGPLVLKWRMRCNVVKVECKWKISDIKAVTTESELNTRLGTCRHFSFNRIDWLCSPVFHSDRVWSIPWLPVLGWILYLEIFDDTMETKLSDNSTLENITFPGREREGRGIFNS